MLMLMRAPGSDDGKAKAIEAGATEGSHARHMMMVGADDRESPCAFWLLRMNPICSGS